MIDHSQYESSWVNARNCTIIIIDAIAKHMSHDIHTTDAVAPQEHLLSDLLDWLHASQITRDHCC